MGRGRSWGWVTGAGAGLLLGGTILATAAPAGATYPHVQNGVIVYSSSYTNGGTPNGCATPPCRHSTAPHPGTTNTLWVVDPQAVRAAGASAVNDPAYTHQLTATENFDNAPSYSPDGTQIVFDRVSNGTGQLYLVPSGNLPAGDDPISSNVALGSATADGATRITSDVHNDTTPSFNPDGKHVAFVQDDTYIQEVDATNPAAPAVTLVDTSSNVIFGNSAGLQEMRPVFNPVDPTELAFVTGNRHIWLETGIGGATQSFYDLSLATGISNVSRDEWPDWSPDGKAIAFDSTRPVTAADPNGNTQQLWVMTVGFPGGTLAASAAPVFVVDPASDTTPQYTGSQDTEPVWSPDGTQLGWKRSAGTDVDNEMFRISSYHIKASATAVDLTLANNNASDVLPNWTGTDTQPVLPEVPYAALLPLGGLAMLSLGVVLGRRRRPRLV